MTRLLAAAWLLILSAHAAAQSPASSGGQAAADSQGVTLQLRDVSRVESWSFFQPPPGGGDPTYTLFGNRATLGVRVRGRRFGLNGAFEYGQLLNLPQQAVGPGALGPGALYFQGARAPNAYQMYFRALSLRARNVIPAISVEIGRMEYTSGAESTAAAPTVDAIRQARVDGRLIGGFEWSMFQRAFDGARVDVNRPRWQATAALIYPTQGGYEESANPTMTRLRLISGTWSTGRVSPTASAPGFSNGIQVFAYHYDDRRSVTSRPDNSGLPASRADISIATLGASHVGVYQLASGRLDSVAWVAAQAGDWYGDRHTAWSGVLETGYQWTARWQPWLRGGALYASGDDDPIDARHQTFFQMVPSSHRYARSQTYAQMNVADLYAQFHLQPAPRTRLTAEWHRVALAEPRDRWYAGSGATAREGIFFGYTARPSLNATGLGTIVEASADFSVTARWSINGYAGWMNGGTVVNRQFAGDRLRFFYLQNDLRF